MSDGSTPELTIPTHFDNPARPRPEFTPTPFDIECPTGIPPVFNKDDYPLLDGESRKDHCERLRKEEDRVDTESKRIKRAMQDFEDLKEEHEEREEGRKMAYEADLESWEQEEEIRQRKWAGGREGVETGYQQRVAEEEEGQKTRKGKGKERSAEAESETEWVPSKKRCVDCVKYDTTCRVPASGRARACGACKKRKSRCSNTG
ncbi:hypothetical protein L218DRAFT_968599, partial [Marasmius fiardii PR-910]